MDRQDNERIERIEDREGGESSVHSPTGKGNVAPNRGEGSPAGQSAIPPQIIGTPSSQYSTPTGSAALGSNPMRYWQGTNIDRSQEDSSTSEDENLRPTKSKKRKARDYLRKSPRNGKSTPFKRERKWVHRKISPLEATPPEVEKEGKKVEDPKQVLLRSDSSAEESDGVSPLESDSLDETIGPDTATLEIKNVEKEKESTFEECKNDILKIIDLITKKKSTNLKDRENMKDLIEKMDREYRRVDHDLTTTLSALSKIGGVANRAPPVRPDKDTYKAGSPSDKAGSSKTREGAISPPLANGTGNPKEKKVEGQCTAMVLYKEGRPTAPMPPPKVPTQELEVQGPQGPRQAQGRPELQRIETRESERSLSLSLDLDGATQPLLGMNALAGPQDPLLILNNRLAKLEEGLMKARQEVLRRARGTSNKKAGGKKVKRNTPKSSKTKEKASSPDVQVIETYTETENMEWSDATEQAPQEGPRPGTATKKPATTEGPPEGPKKAQNKSQSNKSRKVPEAKAKGAQQTEKGTKKPTEETWTKVLGRKEKEAKEPSLPPRTQPRKGGGYKGPGARQYGTSAPYVTPVAPLIHAVTVRSTKGEGADAVKDKLINGIRPTKSGLSIVSWQRAMYGGIRVELASKSQAEAFVAKANTIPTLRAVHQQPKLPRLVFRGVGKDAADEDVLAAIRNRVGHSTGARILKSFLPSKKAKTRNVVVEVTPGLRSEMSRFGRRWQVGWQATEVGDFNQLTQCFNCQLYGHVSKECKAPTRCRWCAEAGHSGDQCPGWDNQDHFVPACYGCQKHKLRGPPHDAGDRNRCGYYRKKFEAHQESIGLGDGHRTGR